MTYTASELVTILAALGVFVAAVGSTVGGLLIALRNGQKADNIATKVDAVHILTNSNLSAVKGELATATSKIEGLLLVVQDLKAERDKSALAAALATPPVAVTIVPAEKPLPVEVMGEFPP